MLVFFLSFHVTKEDSYKKPLVFEYWRIACFIATFTLLCSIASIQPFFNKKPNCCPALCVIGHNLKYHGITSPKFSWLASSSFTGSYNMISRKYGQHYALVERWLLNDEAISLFFIHFLGLFWATLSTVWHCIRLWRKLISLLTVMCWLSFCLLEQRLPSPHAADILCIIYNKNQNHIIFLNIMKEFRPWAQLKFLYSGEKLHSKFLVPQTLWFLQALMPAFTLAYLIFLFTTVRLEIFYTNRFVYNLVAIRLMNNVHSHHTIVSVTISCVKYQGWMCRPLQDVEG